MSFFKTKHTCLMIIFLSAACLNAFAGDLDDGIALDDKIKEYDTLGRPGDNIQYIIRSAKATGSSSISAAKAGSDTAIGGFINKPGAKVRDVTIIFDGKNITTVSK